MSEEERAIFQIYSLSKKLSKSKDPRVRRLGFGTMLIPVTAFEGDLDLEQLLKVMMEFAKEKQNQISGIKELLANHEI
jgi:hypothetical protein